VHSVACVGRKLEVALMFNLVFVDEKLKLGGIIKVACVSCRMLVVALIM
jgi:hypothetical protein